jgi:carbonic anhydrase
MKGTEALNRLKEGNERYVKGDLINLKDITKARLEVAKKQSPFATILGCSDSRVQPTLVFDKNPGDLFIIRVAGNIVDDVVLGSIEYAVENLGSRLVVVLGHERCGAVEAALNALNKITLEDVPGHFNSIIKEIEPAVQITKKQLFPELWESCCINNVQLTVEKVKSSLEKIDSRQYKEPVLIVGAYYHLDTGKVDFFD